MSELTEQESLNVVKSINRYYLSFYINGSLFSFLLLSFVFTLQLDIQLIVFSGYLLVLLINHYFKFSNPVLPEDFQSHTKFQRNHLLMLLLCSVLILFAYYGVHSNSPDEIFSSSFAGIIYFLGFSFLLWLEHIIVGVLQQVRFKNKEPLSRPLAIFAYSFFGLLIILMTVIVVVMKV